MGADQGPFGTGRSLIGRYIVPMEIPLCYRQRLHHFLPNPGGYPWCRPVDSLLISPTKPLIVFRLRMDEAVKRVHNLPTSHNNHPYTVPALICRFKIYGCKVCHCAIYLLALYSSIASMISNLISSHFRFLWQIGSG